MLGLKSRSRMLAGNSRSVPGRPSDWGMPSRSERFRARWAKAVDVLRAHPDPDVKIAGAELREWLHEGRPLDAGDGLRGWREFCRRQDYRVALQLLLSHVSGVENAPRARAVRDLLKPLLRSNRATRTDLDRLCADVLRLNGGKIPCQRKLDGQIADLCSQMRQWRLRAALPTMRKRRTAWPF
jgi:hypothetical protein